MARVTAQELAEKWARRTQAAVPDYQRGVQRVTEAPGQRAAQQVDAYVAGVQRERDKWQQRVGAVSLADWQRAAIEKGAPRVAQGVQQAQGKMQAFANELLPYQDNLRQQLEATPRGDLEQNIQRMVTWSRGMSNFRR